MSGILTWLQGKKTYLVIIIGVLTSGLAYLNGDLTLSQLLNAIWIAAIGGGLRDGVTKSGIGG